MRFVDLLGLSIKNLWRHKVRTFLTVMGVMIGAGAIVIMLSLGLAMNRNFETQASQMGNLTLIQVYHWNQGGRNQDGQEIPDLDDAMIDRFSRMPGVEVATPLMDLQLKAAAGKYVSHLYVMGIKPEALPALGLTLGSGELFGPEDGYVMLASEYAASNFYVPNSRRWESAPMDFNLMEQKITISVDMQHGEKSQPGQKAPRKPFKPITLKVTGVLAMAGGQYDYNLYMPLDQVRILKAEQEKFNKANNNSGSGGGVIRYESSMYGGSSGTQKGYNQAIVKVKDMNSVSAVFEEIKALGYDSYSPIQMIDEMKKQSAGLRQILGGIGAMALLIAAIGITNTMYMSIYERTREIGIIKVIGARLNDIRRLFMVEAGWIGMFGGITGVLFSLGASAFLNHSEINIMGGNQMWGPDGVTRLPISWIPPWLMLAAFGFAIVAALVAGFFPARRAMRLSVMKALRQD